MGQLFLQTQCQRALAAASRLGRRSSGCYGRPGVGRAAPLPRVKRDRVAGEGCRIRCRCGEEEPVQGLVSFCSVVLLFKPPLASTQNGGSQSEKSRAGHRNSRSSGFWQRGLHRGSCWLRPRAQQRRRPSGQMVASGRGGLCRGWHSNLYCSISALISRVVKNG